MGDGASVDDVLSGAGGAHDAGKHLSGSAMTKEQAEEAARYMESQVTGLRHSAEAYRREDERAAAEMCEARERLFRRAALALRAHWPLIEATEASGALTEAVADAETPDHHKDECPGDCAAHALAYLADDAYDKASRALALARKEP